MFQTKKKKIKKIKKPGFRINPIKPRLSNKNQKQKKTNLLQEINHKHQRQQQNKKKTKKKRRISFSLSFFIFFLFCYEKRGNKTTITTTLKIIRKLQTA